MDATVDVQPPQLSCPEGVSRFGPQADRILGQQRLRHNHQSQNFNRVELESYGKVPFSLDSCSSFDTSG
jgi:hypothetical protein